MNVLEKDTSIQINHAKEYVSVVVEIDKTVKIKRLSKHLKLWFYVTFVIHYENFNYVIKQKYNIMSKNVTILR